MSKTANSREAAESVVGKTVVAVLFDVFPIFKPDIAHGTKSLVFSDGCVFTTASNGSFWFEDADALKHHVSDLKKRAEQHEQVAASLRATISRLEPHVQVKEDETR